MPCFKPGEFPLCQTRSAHRKGTWRDAPDGVWRAGSGIWRTKGAARRGQLGPHTARTLSGLRPASPLAWRRSPKTRASCIRRRPIWRKNAKLTRSRRNLLKSLKIAKNKFVFPWIYLAPGLVWLGARFGKTRKNLASGAPKGCGRRNGKRDAPTLHIRGARPTAPAYFDRPAIPGVRFAGPQL